MLLKNLTFPIVKGD